MNKTNKKKKKEPLQFSFHLQTERRCSQTMALDTLWDCKREKANSSSGDWYSSEEHHWEGKNKNITYMAVTKNHDIVTWWKWIIVWNYFLKSGTYSHAGSVSLFQMPCKFEGWDPGREQAINRYRPYWNRSSTREGSSSLLKDFTLCAVVSTFNFTSFSVAFLELLESSNETRWKRSW